MNFKRISILFFCLTCLIFGGCTTKKSISSNTWQDVKRIKAKIIPPKFPDRIFLITDYGAVSDDTTKKSTQAFQKAIQAAHDSGGGKVVVPKGIFLTGAIHLKSNVNLHLKEGATILFSRDPNDYLPMVFTRWEGVELMNYSDFIYAYKQENIAITGKGTLDGNASNKYWWPWKGLEEFGWEPGEPSQEKAREKLFAMNEKQMSPEERKFGPGHYLRPNFIQTYHCKNVLISDIKIRNSPMWEIHPVLSQNVIIDGVNIKSLGPNNDGIDPESSKNVWIKNSYFNTGDDCIAIKSGRNEDGRKMNVPAENIIIENSHMEKGHGGIVIGSEASGGVKNIYGLNLTMDSPRLKNVLRIKTSSKRGGVIENIYLKNIDVGTYYRAAVKANMFYEGTGEFIPTIRNIIIENLQVKDGGKYGILVKAYKESPVENLKIKNSVINDVEEPMNVDYVKNMELNKVMINNKMYNNYSSE